VQCLQCQLLAAGGAVTSTHAMCCPDIDILRALNSQPLKSFLKIHESYLLSKDVLREEGCSWLIKSTR
jgi:hypothetical protein